MSAEEREAIIANKYIDFKKLVNNQHNSDSKSEFAEFLLDTAGCLRWKKKTRRNPLCILEWGIAFKTYLAIQNEHDPSVAPGLLKHQQVVQKLAMDKGDWRKYDKGFRKLV